MEHIFTNLNKIFENIEKAKTRAGIKHDITLIVVTKGRNLDELKAVYKYGIRHLGENRVQEALNKIPQLPKDIIWHMIGPIQSNKAKKVALNFRWIHSIENTSIPSKMSKYLSNPVNVFVEVNTSGESTKHGVSIDKVDELVFQLKEIANINVVGLMTMAPFTDDTKVIRNCFRTLKKLADKLNLPYTSMGMSNDYIIAVEEGATHLRIGTAVFKST